MLPHHYQESAELPAVLLHELDGVLLASPYPRALVERIYRENGCPIVLIDNSLTGSNFDSVMADDFGGGYQVAKHLLDLGHRNILMVAGRALNPVIPPSFCERYRGYQQACLDAGIEPMEMAVLPPAIDPPSLECVEPLLEEWLGALFAVPNPPTAIFCAADLIAVGVMAALSGLGIRVPEDVSLVGFDNLPMASTLKHSLTSVHVYKRGMARVAVDLLLARIEEEDTPAMNITLTTQLIVRESTSAVGSPK